VLSTLVKILIIAGAIAFYWNYGRDLMRTFIPNFGGFTFLSDWIGLFIVLAIAYLIVWIVHRRMEGGR